MLSLAGKKTSELGVYRSFIRTFAETDRYSMFEESTDMKIGTQKCIDGSPKPPHFGITPIISRPTNIIHFFSKEDQCVRDINAIVKNRITVKCNYID